MSVNCKREIEELKRENNSLKLKLSKTLNSLDDTFQEAQTMKLKFERILMDKESTHEREKKILQRVIKDADKELKGIKERNSPSKTLSASAVKDRPSFSKDHVAALKSDQERQLLHKLKECQIELQGQVKLVRSLEQQLQE